MKKTMKIEIWSDIMCPFCYIGKRKFESALTPFADKANVEVIWKSYQLSPDVKTNPDISIHQFLAQHKGMTVQEATQMNNHVAAMAKEAGLIFNSDKMVVANTFNAHRFAHFAKQFGKQTEAEELLFRSYFTDGKNIDDYATLIELGKELNLDSDALKTALENGSFADEVRRDIHEAAQIGVRGVPFFVFDRKYAVSGAQDVQVFKETLETSFKEWREANPEVKLQIIEGNSCTPDGQCD